MNAPEDSARRGGRRLVLIFLLLAAGIVTAGCFYYRAYERRFRAGIEEELSAIAELKVAQIVQWRRERLANANYFRRTPYVARRALDVLAQPASASTRQNFIAWLDAVFEGGSYEQALLLDDRLKVGLVYPKRASAVLGEASLAAAQSALRSRQVIVADLHRETADGPVYLTIMVPLIVRREISGERVPAAGQGSSPTDRSAAVLVLQINARKELYPLVKSWPTPNRTSETLLVRRDGNDALFLNDLKFQTNTAVRLRISLARTNVTAVKAALGQAGIVQGPDYRGVPVVAALRAIPGSPWALVARMDLADVYAPLREHLWQLVALLGALLFVAGASVRLVWRRQRDQFYQDRHQAAAELRWKSAFLEAQVNSSIDGILVVDERSKKILQNQRLTDLLKIPRHIADDQDDEKQLQWVTGITKNPGQFFEKVRYLMAHPNEISRDEMELKEGTILDRYSAPVIDPDGKYYGRIWTFRDITERKRTEAQRERLADIVEASPDFIGFADPKTARIQYINKHGRRMCGIGDDEDLGELRINEVHPAWMNKIIAEVVLPVALRDGFWEGEGAFLHRSGREIPVLMTLLARKGADGEVDLLYTISRDITERKRGEAELENVHRQLLEASRLGGMAEIATNVLHNVGNVLNSVNVSASLVVDSVKKSRISSLAKIADLLHENERDLGAFMTSDARGKHLPAYLARLSDHLLAEQKAAVQELDSLRGNIEHIKEIVAMQQSYARVSGFKESVDIAGLVEDSLRMNEDALSRHRVEVIREFAAVPPITVEKHKILQILVNLLRNAKHACQESDRPDKRLTVRVANGAGRLRISVIDNGIGIPPENLTRIFSHGFTTRKDGHGFGLHSGALAAVEMGGSLTVHSDGPGQGAAFTLELPWPAPEASHE